MASIRILLFVATAASLMACGGSATESETPEASGGDCSYSTSDTCMSDEALTQCQSMAAQCPGQVQMMETCPAQFSCPGEGAGPDGDVSVSSGGEDGDTSVGSDAAACEGYSPGDSCIDESNFAQCQEMAAQCPGEVLVMESCPLQFACP